MALDIETPFIFVFRDYFLGPLIRYLISVNNRQFLSSHLIKIRLNSVCHPVHHLQRLKHSYLREHTSNGEHWFDNTL